MGIFSRIVGFCASCLGLSQQTQHRHKYPNHDIPKVLKHSVSYSYQPTGSRHSSGYSNSQRSSSTTGSLHCSYTATQPTQSRAAQKNDFNNDYREELISSGLGKWPSSYKGASIRTSSTLMKTSDISESAATTSTAPSSTRSNSISTDCYKESQNAFPHQVKQQQSCEIKQSQAQLVRSCTTSDFQTTTSCTKTFTTTITGKKTTNPSSQVKPLRAKQLKPQQRVKPLQAQQVPVNYLLRNFTCKLVNPPVDKTFIPDSNVIYCNQWNACSVIIVDQFGNQLSNPAHKVKLTSNSRVEFYDSKHNGGCLHFKMKSAETGNISISIKIDSVALIKEFYVVHSPCSSALSEMVVKKILSYQAFENDYVLRVSIVDVFGEPVLSNSPVNCLLETSSTENKVVETRMCSAEDGNKYFDITVRGGSPWSKDPVVVLNGKPICPVANFEVSCEERGKIETLLKEENVLLCKDELSIHHIVHRHGSRMFIPFLTGENDFVSYDESNCQILIPSDQNGCQLNCQNVTKKDILGADFANVNNIKRVLELKERVEIKEYPDQTNVIIDLRNVQSTLYPICKEVVQHLLRGVYYRKKASQAAKVRMEWKEKFAVLARILSSLKERPSLKLCKFFKDFFGKLMNKYNNEACNELFRFFNFQRDENEVDLHGLFVADEKKLELLRLDMLRASLSDEEMDDFLKMCKIRSFNGRAKQALKKALMKGEMSQDEINNFIERCRDNVEDGDSLKVFKKELLQRQSRSKDVDALISKFRSESDEAIRKLKETLKSFDLEKAIKNNTPWLEIIVGAGHHSRIKNEQNIRPKVEKLLKERNLKFTAVNKGSLVVTFKTYSGPEPCFGEYYCENCDRCWKSSKSYVGKYQKCSKCEVDCWPVKQREKEKVAKYRRDSAEPTKRKSKAHQSSLCQKCKELGRPCNEEDFYDLDY